jgi:hypothetical protein
VSIAIPLDELEVEGSAVVLVDVDPSSLADVVVGDASCVEELVSCGGGCILGGCVADVDEGLIVTTSTPGHSVAIP